MELFEDHPIAERPYCEAFAWLDLIRRAKWKDGPALKRGQLRASVRFLSEAWGWNVKRVHTLLIYLEGDECIEWVRPPAGSRDLSVITILNYDTYQLINSKNVEKRERNTLPERELKREPERGEPVDIVSRGEVPSRYGNASGNADEREIRNKSVPVPVKTTNETTIQGTLIDLPEIVPSPAKVATAMTYRWVEEQAAKPPDTEIKKQHRAFTYIAKQQNIVDIAQAWEGIGTLYPFSDGSPWDAFDLRKRFGKAFQAGALEIAGGDPGELAAWLKEFGT